MSGRLVTNQRFSREFRRVGGNRDCLTVVNRIYRNRKLEITQNSSLSDTRGGRGTRLSFGGLVASLMNDGRESERSVETAFLRGSRPHSRARLGVEQGAGVSRVRRGASQGRDETRARIARVSRGTSRHRTRGPDPHRLERRPYGRRRWITRRTRPTPRRGSSPATPTACWAMMPRRTTSTPSTCVSRPPRRPSRRAPAARQKRHRAIRWSRERRARTDEAKDVGAIAPSRRARSRASTRTLTPRRVADVHGRTGIAIESPARLARIPPPPRDPSTAPPDVAASSDVYAAATSRTVGRSRRSRRARSRRFHRKTGVDSIEMLFFGFFQRPILFEEAYDLFRPARRADRSPRHSPTRNKRKQVAEGLAKNSYNSLRGIKDWRTDDRTASRTTCPRCPKGS